jgi:hypothetical protein
MTTSVRITTYKIKRNWSITPKIPEWDKSKIDKVQIIPREGINIEFPKREIFGRREFKIKGASSISVNEKQMAEFIDMDDALIPKTHWYDDDTKRTHIMSYDSVAEASSEANRAAKRGWVPTGSSATDGHLNIGRTAAGVFLFGGLSLLAGGSRTEGKVTITYNRASEWLEEHTKNANVLDSNTAVQAAALTLKPTHASATKDPTDVVTQLERLAKLKEQGVLTEEEFQGQKKTILKT